MRFSNVAHRQIAVPYSLGRRNQSSFSGTPRVFHPFCQHLSRRCTQDREVRNFTATFLKTPTTQSIPRRRQRRSETSLGSGLLLRSKFTIVKLYLKKKKNPRIFFCRTHTTVYHRGQFVTPLGPDVSSLLSVRHFSRVRSRTLNSSDACTRSNFVFTGLFS